MNKGRMKWAIIFHANGLTTLHYGLNHTPIWKASKELDIKYVDVDIETMHNVLQEQLNKYNIRIETIDNEFSEDGSMMVYYGEGVSFGK